MKKFQTGKRVLLFIAVNLLVVMTLSIVLGLLGVNRRVGPENYSALIAFCLVWGMGGAFISLALSRVMAKWLMGVQIVDPRTNDPALRDLVDMVHGMAQKAGLPEMPQVGIYDSEEVNAFATGPTRARALVAVSTGLLRTMNRREVEGVLGHEIAHVANGDMVTMTLLQGVINAIVMFLARVLAFVVSQALRSRDGESRGGGGLNFILVFVFEIVFSLFGAIVVCWFSRHREFRADVGGAALAGRDNMIGALVALQEVHERVAAPDAPASFQSLKIANRPGGFMKLFKTHPPLEERIAALRSAGR